MLGEVHVLGLRVFLYKCECCVKSSFELSRPNYILDGGGDFDNR